MASNDCSVSIPNGALSDKEAALPRAARINKSKHTPNVKSKNYLHPPSVGAERHTCGGHMSMIRMERCEQSSRYTVRVWMQGRGRKCLESSRELVNVTSIILLSR